MLELLTLVNIALGHRPVAGCPEGDANRDGQITIDELLTAVGNALHGCPTPVLKAKLLGHVRTLNRLGSAMPGAANRLMQLRPMRALLGRVLGLADQRSLPRFERSLYRWFSSRTIRADSPAPRIALFGDCFTTYNEPRIGRAAVGVLEALGYRVELPRAGCCGRAMISPGLLDGAIATIDATVAQLAPLAQDDSVAAIVVCEPSCLAAMKDEWLGLRVRSPLSIRRLALRPCRGRGDGAARAAHH